MCIYIRVYICVFYTYVCIYIYMTYMARQGRSLPCTAQDSCAPAACIVYIYIYIIMAVLACIRGSACPTPHSLLRKRSRAHGRSAPAAFRWHWSGFGGRMYPWSTPGVPIEYPWSTPTLPL